MALVSDGAVVNEIIYSSFVGNQYIKGAGAAISAGSNFYIGAIEWCVFENNTANSGGAVDLRSGTLERVSNCTFSGNTATTSGGALRVTGVSFPVLEFTTFSGNNAGTELVANSSVIHDIGAYGGALEVAGSVGSFSFATVADVSTVVFSCNFTGNNVGNKWSGRYERKVPSSTLHYESVGTKVVILLLFFFFPFHKQLPWERWSSSYLEHQRGFLRVLL